MVLQDSEVSTVDSTRGAKKQQPILPADRRAHPGVEPGKCGRTRRARNPQYRGSSSQHAYVLGSARNPRRRVD